MLILFRFRLFCYDRLLFRCWHDGARKNRLKIVKNEFRWEVFFPKKRSAPDVTKKWWIYISLSVPYRWHLIPLNSIFDGKQESVAEVKIWLHGVMISELLYCCAWLAAMRSFNLSLRWACGENDAIAFSLNVSIFTEELSAQRALESLIEFISPHLFGSESFL